MTPLNSPSASMAVCGSTPTRQGRAQRRRGIQGVVFAALAPLPGCPVSRPLCKRPVREPPGLSIFTCQSPSASAEKRSSRLQQPWRSTGSRCGIFTVANDHAVAGNGAHQVMELGLDAVQIRINIRVVVFKVVQHAHTRAGSAQTWRACRKTPCRIRRPQPRKMRCRHGPNYRSYGVHRQSGSPAPARRVPVSTPACWRWWFCRGCRPPPARSCSRR